MYKKPQYYDWEKTISYDADVTMVIGARGFGKTFGLRKQCVNDYIKRGWRFVEVTRYKAELSGVSNGYFDRLARLDEFSGYVFRTDAQHGYIAEKPENDSEKPKWQLIMYFVSLNDQQKLKKQTFDKVRRIIFDEAILERADRYHRYLQNEYGILANIVDTVSRERGDVESLKPRLYLLGNACDIGNPYFAVYHVETDLKYGYRWYANKTFLLHYVEAGEYGKTKAANTVAGRMLAGTDAGRVSISNEFIGTNKEFVEPKTKNAKFSFGIVVDGRRFGIWIDPNAGRYYVSGKIPNNSDGRTYYLTIEDGSVNYIAATRASTVMRTVTEIYYLGLLRYETVKLKTEFARVLALFGVR